MNILVTLKKTLIFKMNFKTLQVQKMFQNCFKISELEKSFIIYKFLIMYMMY